MGIELGNQVLIQVRREMADNIREVKAQFVDWLERPDSGGVDSLSDGIREVGGGLSLLGFDSSAKLAYAISESVQRLNSDAAKRVDEQAFVESGAEVASALLVLEDFIARIGQGEDVGSGFVDESHAAIKSTNQSLAAMTSLVGTSKVDQSAYDAVAENVSDVLKSTRQKIEHYHRSQDKSLAIDEIKDSNDELVRMFVILDIVEPQLLLNEINKLIRIDAEEKTWIDIAEAMILVESAFVAGRQDNKVYVEGEHANQDLISKQRAFNRQLVVNEVLNEIGGDAVHYFEGFRKDLVRQESLGHAQDWQGLSTHVAYYYGVTSLAGLERFSQALKKLGQCYAQISIHQSDYPKGLYAAVIDSLVGVEYLFNDVTYAGKVQNQDVEFLEQAIAGIMQTLPVSEAANKLFAKVCDAVVDAEDQSFDNDFAAALSEGLDALAGAYTPASVIEELQEKSALEAEVESETLADVQKLLDEEPFETAASVPSSRPPVRHDSVPGRKIPDIAASDLSEAVAQTETPPSSPVKHDSEPDRKIPDVAASDLSEVVAQTEIPPSSPVKHDSEPDRKIPDVAASDLSEAVAHTETPPFFQGKTLVDIQNMVIPDDKLAFSESHEDAVIDEEIREFFLEELDEIIAFIQEYLPDFCGEGDNSSAAQEIRRSFHTLKGSGRTVGYESLGEFAWQHEQLLNNVLEGHYTANLIVQETVRDAADLLGLTRSGGEFHELHGAFLQQAKVAENVRIALLDNPNYDDLKALSAQLRLGGTEDSRAAAKLSNKIGTHQQTESGRVSKGVKSGLLETTTSQTVTDDRQSNAEAVFKLSDTKEVGSPQADEMASESAMADIGADLFDLEGFTVEDAVEVTADEKQDDSTEVLFKLSDAEEAIGSPQADEMASESATADIGADLFDLEGLTVEDVVEVTADEKQDDSTEVLFKLSDAEEAIGTPQADEMASESATADIGADLFDLEGLTVEDVVEVTADEKQDDSTEVLFKLSDAEEAIGTPQADEMVSESVTADIGADLFDLEGFTVEDAVEVTADEKQDDSTEVLFKLSDAEEAIGSPQADEMVSESATADIGADLFDLEGLTVEVTADEKQDDSTEVLFKLSDAEEIGSEAEVSLDPPVVKVGVATTSDDSSEAGLFELSEEIEVKQETALPDTADLPSGVSAKAYEQLLSALKEGVAQPGSDPDLAVAEALEELWEQHNLPQDEASVEQLITQLTESLHDGGLNAAAILGEETAETTIISSDVSIADTDDDGVETGGQGVRMPAQQPEASTIGYSEVESVLPGMSDKAYSRIVNSMLRGLHGAEHDMSTVQALGDLLVSLWGGQGLPDDLETINHFQQTLSNTLIEQQVGNDALLEEIFSHFNTQIQVEKGASGVPEEVIDDGSISDAPISDEPISDEPISDEPISDEPISDEPISDEPISDEPVSDAPISDEPISDAPISDEPVSDEPVSDEPVSDEPVSDEPVSDEPVSDEPVSDAPVSDAPVSDAPVSAELEVGVARLDSDEGQEASIGSQAEAAVNLTMSGTTDAIQTGDTNFNAKVFSGEAFIQQRLDEELSSLAQHPALDDAAIPQEAEATMAHEHVAYLTAVDKFESLSNVAGAEQSSESLERLLEAVYDIEDSLDASTTPEWVWRLLDAIEQLLVLYRASDQGISSGCAEIFRQGVKLMEDYSNKDEDSADEVISALMKERQVTLKSEVSTDKVDETEAILEPVAPEQEAVSLSERTQISDPNAQTELSQTFLDEAMSLFGKSQEDAEHWGQNLEQLNRLDNIRRNMHTIKGSARMVGYEAIGDLTHLVESLIECIVDGQVSASDRAASLLIGSMWQGILMLDDVRDGFLPVSDPYLLNNISSFINQPLPYPEVEAQLQKERAQQEMGVEDVVEAVVTAEQAPTTDKEESVGALDPVLVEIFSDEAQEIIETLQQQIDGDLKNQDKVEELKRSLHTLKGGARLVGVSSMGDTAHEMESIVDRLEDLSDNELSQARSLLELGTDTLYEMLDGILRKELPPPADALNRSLSKFASGQGYELPQLEENAIFERDEQKSKAESLVIDEPVSENQALAEKVEKKDEPTAEKTPPEQVARTAGDLPHFVRVDAKLLDEMIAMVGEMAIMRSRMDTLSSATEFNLGELTRIADRIDEQMRRLDSETEAQMLFRREQQADDDEDFDPLEMDRFSEMQQLSRQLAEAVDDLKNVNETLEQDNTVMRNVTHQQGLVQRNIQDRLMTTQLMRFDVHEPRLKRLTRQTATSIGKEVELILEGGYVELERRLLEDILPALEHIVRNAIFHGIETPPERLAKAKSEVGIIKIIVELRAAELSVRIIDDGAGFNFDKIREKAAEKGILDESRKNDERYLSSLLFRSGFTTAKSLSQIAGRGVGMDVVNEMIKQRRGQIQGQSIVGKGSEFIITMPFSMSISEVLLVEIAGQIYAAPMSSITAVSQVASETLQRVVDGEMIYERYDDMDYRLFVLGQYFNPEDFEFVRDGRSMPVLYIKAGGEPVGFHIDRILNRLEIIVKNVNRQVLNIPGISGATILGDGAVVPVLELLDLSRSIVQMSPALEAPEAVEEADQTINILVVDDSVTMRKVSTRLLERYDYMVASAKDGIDAIEVLGTFTPDLILLDIEMPRMDGFEFASYVRQESDVPDVPIVMVTSRTGDKHRERADAIGVQGYLGKPYREDVLIETLTALLGSEEQADD